jgi:hypothetical protein
MSAESIVTLIAAILAFIASLAAIYNSRFRRFALERWWERKADAYTRIIEALSDLVDYYRQMCDEEINPRRTINDKTKQEMVERSKRGHREVDKAADIGAFLISPEADAALQRFRQEPKDKPDPHDWYSIFENEYSRAKQCLKEMVECAKNDLRV